MTRKPPKHYAYCMTKSQPLVEENRLELMAPAPPRPMPPESNPWRLRCAVPMPDGKVIWVWERRT